ncbi:CBS domain-containing protein [Rhodopirellula rubra]|uniref:CBS domain-containing protein n=1 Tax=Aporhodopirellula rubra TaxID=980271 RepID=A0A7W5E392_9BACT|nr:DUF1588 domain-containing protein [Aporhodopirellula rubra]MBB3209390.1 CBS domain-containing protein [Aporhodopirellula rubra]
MMRRSCVVVGLVWAACQGAHAQDQDFQQVLVPLFQQHCLDCHGADEANADIDFDKLATAEDLLARPAWIDSVLDAIASGAMPPDGEPGLNQAEQTQAVNSLRAMLRKATEHEPPTGIPVSRLNRFQYNNTVRDLFDLDRDVFPLPEKLMTRHHNYLHDRNQGGHPFHMPDTVQVASHSLQPQPGLEGVKPFPKDLRAEHGFDNQASQLTLSPLLLDAFLRLSVSIVESPQFNEQTVGIWGDFFAEPVDSSDHNGVIRQRLEPFLRIAFRGPVDDETIGRYTSYAIAKMDGGLSFPDGMKKVAAAVLSSPLFLYRSPATDPSEQPFVLASRLSYFLWGSCPDQDLLRLAATGQLSDPAILDQTLTRMLADPRIERFLDSFPSQWMQLENVLAVTPDPQINRYFALAPNLPASVQMVLEPLLLFDTVFVEDRPIADLLAPDFAYQSEFLKTWYHSELSPPPVDVQAIEVENQQRDTRRRELQEAIAGLEAERSQLVEPVRRAVLQERQRSESVLPPVDLKPYASWDFDGDLSESVRGLDLTAHGEIQFRDGRVVLDGAHLLSKPLPIDFNAKTMEVWFQLATLEQRGGGLMGLQVTGGLFESIVLGERQNLRWMSGSNGFERTEDIVDAYDETIADDLLHLVMVYEDDGTKRLYRNGLPYGQPYQKGQATFPRDVTNVMFGLRHLPPGGDRFLSVSIDRARLYDRALTVDEVEAAVAQREGFVTTRDLVAAMTPDQRLRRDQLVAALADHREKLNQVPVNIDPASVVRAAQQTYDDQLRTMMQAREFQRVPIRDPRYGGIITNAAVLSMTSGPQRTHPVARGVWVIEVIFNDPPDPPPNDVPPLNEEAGDKDQTIRERFAAHRDNASCAGCHTKLDPLGFALENFDITGRWRDVYDNGRAVDASGTLMRKHDFVEAISFKAAVVKERHRFAKAFTKHLLRFALAQELTPADTLVVDEILARAADDNYRLQTLLGEVIRSERFSAP